MPVAEIIAIGTELLLGEIQDTNTRFLARLLRDAGVDLFRTTIVGDNAERISQVILDSLTRAEIVLTTGGLGPTVDDPTRQAVAMAAGVDLEYRPDLWEQILQRFQRFNRPPTENNRRQAFIPRGSQAVENQVGTAPCFITEINGRYVISLPGVPREMEFVMQNNIMPFLRRQFNLHGTIKARVLHLAGMGESQVDDLIGDFELLKNPTVGLAAHSGQIDIRITAKADSVNEANAMISQVESEIRKRVGLHIYGADEDTLRSTVMNLLQKQHLSLVVVDYGSGGELTRQLVEGGVDPAHTFVNLDPQSGVNLETELRARLQQTGANCGLASSYIPGTERQDLELLVITPTKVEAFSRSYGGPPANGWIWSLNTALDALRRTLLSSSE